MMNRARPLVSRDGVGSVAGIALSAIVLVSVAAEKRDSPPRIAYVSVQRIAAQSTTAVAAAKSIQQFREERAREIANKRQAIEALRLQIAQLGGLFQASKRTEARQREAREVTELQRLESDAQTRLQALQHDAQADFQRDLSAVISEFARQRGIDIVLNQDAAVVWARVGIDWTDEVTRAVNARHQK